MQTQKVTLGNFESTVVYQQHPTARKTIFFLHGRGGHKEQWHHQITYFKSHYHIVAIDLPGHGQSEYISPNKNYQPYDLETITTIIKQLIERYGSEENMIFAHSLGGAHAYAVSVQFQKLLAISHLVLVSPSPCCKSDKAVCQFWAQPIDTLERYRADLNHFFEISGFHKQTCQALIKQQVDVAKQNQLAMIQAMILGMSEISIAPARLEIPVLLITSAFDVLVPEKKSLAFYLNAPQIKHIQMEHSAHFAQLEEPEQVNQEINRWLRSCP